MFRMSKRILIGVMVLALGFCVGCAHRFPYKENPLDYQPTPIPAHQRIDKIVGLNLLLDQRPENERGKLPPDKRLYHNFTQSFTNLLLQNFQKSQIFKEIHSPAQPTDDLIINGSINRLFFEGWEKTWLGKAYESWWSFFFPPISLSLLFGAPYANEYCIIDISLEVKDNKTNTTLARFTESAKAVQGISMGTNECGQDVTQAFQQITKELKENLLELKF